MSVGTLAVQADRQVNSENGLPTPDTNAESGISPASKGPVDTSLEPPPSAPEALDLKNVAPPEDPVNKLEKDLGTIRDEIDQRAIIKTCWRENHAIFQSAYEKLLTELRTPNDSQKATVTQLFHAMIDPLSILNRINILITTHQGHWETTLREVQNETGFNLAKRNRFSESTALFLERWEGRDFPFILKKQLLRPLSTFTFPEQFSKHKESSGSSNGVKHISNGSSITQRMEALLARREVLIKEFFTTCLREPILNDLLKVLVTDLVNRKPEVGTELSKFISQLRKGYSKLQVCMSSDIGTYAMFKPGQNFKPRFEVSFELVEPISTRDSIFSTIDLISRSNLPPFKRGHQYQPFISIVREYLQNVSKHQELMHTEIARLRDARAAARPVILNFNES